MISYEPNYTSDQQYKTNYEETLSEEWLDWILKEIGTCV